MDMYGNFKAFAFGRRAIKFFGHAVNIRLQKSINTGLPSTRKERKPSSIEYLLLLTTPTQFKTSKSLSSQNEILNPNYRNAWRLVCRNCFG